MNDGRTQEYRDYSQGHRHYGFALGLLTGTFVGAGLAIWLVPRSASELRHRMSDSAKRLDQLASEQYQLASTRVRSAFDEITRTGQSVRDGVAGAVARSAHEVERYAMAAKTGRLIEVGTHSAA